MDKKTERHQDPVPAEGFPSPSAPVAVQEIPSPQLGTPWLDLILHLDVAHVRILELVYLPEPRPWAFKELDRQVRRLNYCTKTVRTKVAFLEQQGLVRLVTSYGLFVNPVPGLAQNARQLVKLCKQRFGIG